MIQNNHPGKEIDEHHLTLEKSKDLSNKQGAITILLIFGLFGLWAIFAQIETTITASGKVITHSYNKSVKHTRGGIVKKIFVKEGDLVKKGDPLLALESFDEQAKLSGHISTHDSTVLAICRLKAQSQLLDTLQCNESEKQLFDKPGYSKLIMDAKMLFASNTQNFKAKINLITNRNQVLAVQNKGLEQEMVSNKKLLVSYQKELRKWNKLLKDDAIDELKVVETQRRIVEITLRLNSTASRIQENNATIEAHNQEIVWEKEQFKNKAFLERNELMLENKLTYENIVAYQERVKNLTIKAPSDGLITDMKIRSTGEVVSPQKQIMSIVPNTQNLLVEAFVQPTDIEKLYEGEEAEIAFPAFVDPSAIPITGEIIYISADTITLEGEKESIYTIRIEFTEEGLKAIEKNKFKIVPGMPATGFIHTGKKTLFAYLMNPVIQMFKGIYHAN